MHPQKVKKPTLSLFDDIDVLEMRLNLNHGNDIIKL